MPDPPTSANDPLKQARLPPFAMAWMRYLLGFGVSVAVGLAPYLGKVHIPLFTPLLSLIPMSIQDIAITLSSAFMGIIAVIVQWRRSGSVHNWEFGAVVSAALLLLLTLTVLEMTAIVHIQVPAANNQMASFAVGFTNPEKPPCENLGRQLCISRKLGFDEDQIASYYGDNATNFTKLALILTYVLFMSCFGFMVGLLLLRESQGRAATAGPD